MYYFILPPRVLAGPFSCIPGHCNFKISQRSLLRSVVKNPSAMLETQVRSLGWEDPLEEEMVRDSSNLAWVIPRRGDHGGLQFTGSQRIGHDSVTQHSTLICTTPGCYTLNFCFFSVYYLFGCTGLHCAPQDPPSSLAAYKIFLVAACVLVPHQGFITGPPALGVPHPYIDFFNPTSRQPSCFRYCCRH